MSKPTHEKLFLGDIEVPAGRRSLNEATVRDIADSMRAVGQLQPITVIDTGESYRLISGAHRVAAARLIADAIHAICEALAGKIRRLQSSDEQRLFCIYDQTVCRIDSPDLPPVGTHASIFLRVLAPKGTPGSKKVRKDYAGLIRELFLAGRIAASSYRNGLCASLNYRAGNGEFIRHGEPEGTSPAGVEPGPN